MSLRRSGRRRAGVARGRLRRALPARGELFFGAAGWAVAMAASALIELLRAGWRQTGSLASVGVIFAVGGLIAFPLAVLASRLLGFRRSPEARFAASFLALAGLTVGVTAGIYALWYRDYYAEWHDATFTLGWFFEFGFTVAGALYQFAVLGLRLYLPFAFLCLIGVSAWLAGKAR